MPRKKKPPLISRCEHCFRTYQPTNNSPRQRWCKHPLCQQDKQEVKLERERKRLAKYKKPKAPIQLRCHNCGELFSSTKRGFLPLFCNKPECQEARIADRKAKQREHKRKSYLRLKQDLQKPKQAKLRKCRSYEIFGFKPSGCKGIIDNGNHFYCSFCHTYISRRQRVETHEINLQGGFML